MSTSQLHLSHHLGRASPSTQGTISLVIVGNQDLQLLPLSMEPTMAQRQAISRYLLKVSFQFPFELRKGMSSLKVRLYCFNEAA